MFLICIAVFVEESDSQARIKVILIAVLMAVMNSVLSHATARAIRIRQLGRWPLKPEENVPLVEKQRNRRQVAACGAIDVILFQLSVLLLVAVSGTLVVFARDHVSQPVGISFFGSVLAIMFMVFQAPEWRCADCDRHGGSSAHDSSGDCQDEAHRPAAAGKR